MKTHICLPFIKSIWSLLYYRYMSRCVKQILYLYRFILYVLCKESFCCWVPYELSVTALRYAYLNVPFGIELCDLDFVSCSEGNKWNIVFFWSRMIAFYEPLVFYFGDFQFSCSSAFCGVSASRLRPQHDTEAFPVHSDMLPHTGQTKYFVFFIFPPTVSFSGMSPVRISFIFIPSTDESELRSETSGHPRPCSHLI